MSSSRQRRGSGRPPRGRDWGGQTLGAALTTNSTSSSYALLPSQVRENYVDPTILASRFKFSAVSLSAQTQTGAIGAGVIRWTDADDTVDGAPGPISLPNLDWILRVVYPVPNGTPASTFFGPNLDYEYFSRAMRRMGQDHGLLVVAENFNVTGTVNYCWDYRFLLAE